jgi:hypothetical protein
MGLAVLVAPLCLLCFPRGFFFYLNQGRVKYGRGSKLSKLLLLFAQWEELDCTHRMRQIYNSSVLAELPGWQAGNFVCLTSVLHRGPHFRQLHYLLLR